MKKYVIYTDSNENLESLIEKIELSLDFKSKLYVFIAEESPIFNDKKNFEIFNEKIKKIDKEIILVSKNIELFKLANQYNIQFRNSIDDNLIFSENKIKIKKIWENERKIWEYCEVKYSFENLKEKLPNLKFNSYFQDKKEKINEIYSLNKKIVFPLIFWSFFLIFAILFLIIPKSQIYIESSSKVIRYTANFNFIEENWWKKIKTKEKNNVWYKKIERLYEDNLVVNVHWKSFEWTYASGVITIENAFWEDIAFKKWTRMQTEDWIIFKTNYYINIPKSKKIIDENWKSVFKNWKAKVRLTAQDTNVFWEIIWEKWNILQWTELKIPWLTSYLQKFMSVKVKKDFVWWTTKWRKVVTEEDLKIASEKIKNLLFKKWENEIKKEIEKINKENLTNYQIFPDKKYLKITLSKVEIPENLLWEKKETITVTWAIVVNAIYYDYKNTAKKIEENLRKKISPEMKLTFIDWKNLSVRAFENDKINKKIKATLTIEWRENFDLFSGSESSKNFLEEIKKNLLNLKKESAEKYLKSIPEISSVKINLWPPFVNKLPKIEDWIEIKEKIYEN